MLSTDILSLALIVSGALAAADQAQRTVLITGANRSIGCGAQILHLETMGDEFPPISLLIPVPDDRVGV